VVGALVILAGAAQGAVGWLGWRGMLRRNRFVGVRTDAAMASEDAFRLANRVAAPSLLAAAAVAVLGGVAALAAPSSAAYVVVLCVAALGALGLMMAGGVLGSRAAALGPTALGPTALGPTALGPTALGPTARQAVSAFTPCAGCACGDPGSSGCPRDAVTDS
jgi:hypothetical protein